MGFLNNILNWIKGLFSGSSTTSTPSKVTVPEFPPIGKIDLTSATPEQKTAVASALTNVNPTLTPVVNAVPTIVPQVKSVVPPSSAGVTQPPVVTADPVTKIMNAVLDSVLTGNYNLSDAALPNILPANTQQTYPNWQNRVAQIGSITAKQIQTLWQAGNQDAAKKIIADAFTYQIAGGGPSALALLKHTGVTFINDRGYEEIGASWTSLFQQLLWMDMDSVKRMMISYGISEADLKTFFFSYFPSSGN